MLTAIKRMAKARASGQDPLPEATLRGLKVPCRHRGENAHATAHVGSQLHLPSEDHLQMQEAPTVLELCFKGVEMEWSTMIRPYRCGALIGFTPTPTHPSALHTRARPYLLSRH